jgi:hypothetical protein
VIIRQKLKEMSQKAGMAIKVSTNFQSGLMKKLGQKTVQKIIVSKTLKALAGISLNDPAEPSEGEEPSEEPSEP